MPSAAPVDPASAVQKEAVVPEEKRFCSNCGAPVGRARPDAPQGRTTGVCSQCRHRFDFEAKLHPGDLVGGQYEVAGPLAHGGLGWVYLARDKAVNDRWVVLKGLLDAADTAAMRVAMAERQFLAELSHPNIVGIFNFVTDRGAGYIVEEFVGGKSVKQLLVERRDANGGTPDPLPPADALAYILAILPAFSYLHGRGLLYCDFKPDNLIQVGDQMKLIDMGAVRRIDDATSDVYGTVGYQAPEVPDVGPTIASDIYTIGRTLAVMVLNFRGFQTQLVHALPEPADHPVLQRFNSLHRLLLKATAPHPDDRFQTVGEFGEQAMGVLREVVAVTTGKPQPSPSVLFGPAPDDGSLPTLAVNTSDPAAPFLANLPTDDAERAIAALRDAVASGAIHESAEVRLRSAQALIQLGDAAAAQAELDAVEADDPWEWRAVWLRGVLAVAGGDLESAASAFDRCRSDVPGEIAPRLAAAIVAERRGHTTAAAGQYAGVVATDPSYVEAARGLARCRSAGGDVDGALAALACIPPTHRAHAGAELAAVELLIRAGQFDNAAARLKTAGLAEAERAAVESELYEHALDAVRGGKAGPAANGTAMSERSLRLALEQALRRRAHLVADAEERLALLDRANRERPLTIL